MKLKEFVSMQKDVAFEAAEKSLLQSSILPRAYRKPTAGRLFGRSDADSRIAGSAVIPALDNGKVSRKCIGKIKLERLAASNNRITCLQVADR